MTVILGISCYHPDSAACLVVDGNVIAAISEERLGFRQKHVGGFPHNAVQFVLDHANLKISDVNHIAIARDTKANRMQRAKRYLSLNGAMSAFKRVKKNSGLLNADLKQLQKFSGCNKISYNLHFVEHHLAHIASSYFTSPFDTDVTGFSYDGAGDGVTCAWANCDGYNINIEFCAKQPWSLLHSDVSTDWI